MLFNTFHPCSLISYRSSLLNSSVSILLIKVNELFSVVSMNWILFIFLEHYKKQLKSLMLKSYQLILQILRKGFEKFLKFGLDDELTIRLFLVTLKIIFVVRFGRIKSPKRGYFCDDRRLKNSRLFQKADKFLRGLFLSCIVKKNCGAVVGTHIVSLTV